MEKEPFQPVTIEIESPEELAVLYGALSITRADVSDINDRIKEFYPKGPTVPREVKRKVFLNLKEMMSYHYQRKGE